MLKNVFFLLLVSCISLATQAQLKGLMKKVQNKVNERIDRKTDETIDKTLDDIEGKGKPAGGTKAAEPADTEAGDKKVRPVADKGISSFAQYDFVPGDSILYYDDFNQDVNGELPIGWNTNGSAEVVTLDKMPGNWLRLHQSFAFLSRNEKNFGDNYTVEFDLVLQLKNTGYMYPLLHFGLFASGEQSTTDNSFLSNQTQNAAVVVKLQPGEFKSSRIKLESFSDGKDWFHNEGRIFESIEHWYGQSVHVSMQVQKERLRLWMNGEKIYDLPKAVPNTAIMNQIYFQVDRSNYKEDEYGIYINNLKVARGRADTRHKLLDEGRFSTSAILFDVNAASIKPESEPVIKEIASLLKEYKEVKIKIVGHTDSDGADADNLLLSKKRAESVKDKLVSSYQIDAARISTDGKGEAEPLADNKTKEGKAANRRVEFIKM